MKILLFSSHREINKDLFIEYFDAIGKEFFYYSYNGDEDCYQFVPKDDLSLIRKDNWFDFISFRYLGEELPEEDIDSCPDVYYPIYNELRIDKTFIQIVESKKIPDDNVSIREIPTGKMYRVNLDMEYDVEILEFFDPDEWNTATD